MLYTILILVLIFTIVPFATGFIPAYFVAKSKRTIAVIYIGGFLYDLAIFQLVAVPFIISNPWGFESIIIIYSIMMIASAIAGIALFVISKKKDSQIFAESSLKRNLMVEEIVEWCIFAGILIFQLVMFARMSSFDGDDAYYVVESLLSQETGTLYRIRPYTGLSTSIDLRHSLATFPIWLSYIAQICGAHATVLCHLLSGFFLIPLTYAIYMEIGRNVLRKERKKLPIFMIFVAIMQVFGNVSIYTNATFFLTRTWQGKSILANVCIPAIIWLLLSLFDSDQNDNGLGLWIILFIVNIVAAMSSTASVFLMAMLIGLSGLLLSIKEKNLQILLKLIITCIPLVVYGVLYLLL